MPLIQHYGTLKIMVYMWHETTPPKWQEKQSTLHAHVLQQQEWGLFQEALGHKTFYAAEAQWSWLAVLEKSHFGSRLYCPYGPTATSLKALEEALVALCECAVAQRATYVRVEPQGNFSEQDFRQLKLRPAHRSIQPHFTWVKDLHPDEETLLADMTATNRNLHRTAANKGLTFHASYDPDDISIFLDMMHEVAGRNQISIHSDQYFTTMAKTLMPHKALVLYTARQHDEPVAASLAFDDSSTRYYAHAASRASARKMHPGTPLVTHMIFDAKRNGQTAFDFYGIAPPNQPNHPWSGFTQFKQSFGGHIVDRHGTWELPVKKLPYSFYRASLKIQKLIK